MALAGCARRRTPLDALYRASVEAQRHGKYAQALQEAGEGLRRAAREAPRSDWPWKFALLRAEALQTQGRRRDAQAELDHLDTGRRPPEFQARYLLLKAKLRSGDEARLCLEQARKIVLEAGVPGLLPSILERLALFADDFGKADSLLSEAESSADKSGDRYAATRALVTRGYVRMPARCAEAIPLLQKAKLQAEQIGARPLVVRAAGNLGWCYLQLGNLDLAASLLVAAELEAAEIGDLDVRHRWAGDLGVVYFEGGHLDQAIDCFKRAAAIAGQADNDDWRVNWLADTARAYLDKGDLASAEKFNREAADLQRGTGKQWEAYVALNGAAIADGRRRYAEAERGYRDVIRSQSKGEPNLLWQGHAGLAWLYERSGRRTEAAREYQATLAVIDQEWASLTQNEHKITFLARLIRFYQDYVQFLSLRGEREKALEAAENARARVLSGRLQHSFSGSGFQSRDAVELARKTHFILLSYWLAPEASYAWAVTSAGVSQMRLPGQAKICEISNAYSEDISKRYRDPLRSGSLRARQLYAQLVAPAGKWVPAGSNVVIVPDGCLHDLNFETLIAGEEHPHYWIEDVTISVAPSLSLLQAGPPRDTRQPRLLVIGAPEPGAADTTPLTYAQSEIDGILPNYAENRRAVYTRSRASPASYRQAHPRDFTIIHFTAHADTDWENPLNSAILLSRDASGTSRLCARDVLDIPLDAELVTISACRSAGSKAYSGEGLMGFAWAFLWSGARNVIAGIWNVDDRATPQLMQHLYHRLAAGDSPPVALRYAKLRILHAGPLPAKPYYWGEFQLFTRLLENRAAVLTKRAPRWI